MGYRLSLEGMNSYISNLSKEYKIFAPKVFKGEGTFSDTDIVRYGEVSSIEEIEFNKKSAFSYKEVLLPIRQTLFFFTEDKVMEASIPDKKVLIFLRSCDIHSLKRIDNIYLNNKFQDPYYKKIRENAKFILIGCKDGFDNCFCVNMGTNKTEDYDGYINKEEDKVFLNIKDKELNSLLDDITKFNSDVTPQFVEENKVKVNIPENLDNSINDSKVWEEYSQRCIACGRCNFVCPTCTCYTMQDIFNRDNENTGERRRVWASCQVDGFTNMAGGHSFRNSKGDRMRYKVMHKVHDYKEKWGHNMCVGCGRCDDICPEYISFSNCINKLDDAMKEMKSNA